jgi:hypothetical protein
MDGDEALSGRLSCPTPSGGTKAQTIQQIGASRADEFHLSMAKGANMAGKVHVITLGLGILALICWAVMFLAGTDVWHDVGRPDFWNQSGDPHRDLRALAYAFYLLFVVLAAQLTVAVFAITRARTTRG